VPSKERGRPLTLTSERAAAAAAVLGSPLVVPAHYDSWAHFSEGPDRIVQAFDDAGLSAVLRMAEPGSWVEPPMSISVDSSAPAARATPTWLGR
jgi:L-ascorbate metabolism protein UlaG (beta-lactamase superfamily)